MADSRSTKRTQQGEPYSKIEYWGKDTRMEGTHGTDVYMGYFDEFQRVQHYSIQCKAETINSSATSGGSASFHTIKNQIEAGRNFPFPDPFLHNVQSRFAGFYVVTSKTVTRDARSLFLELHFPNLHVLDVDDLLAAISLLAQKS
jgi:hypothetical protein